MQSQAGEKTIYRCSRYWDFNITGALFGGLGAAVLLMVVFSIILWDSAFSRAAIIWFTAICIIMLGTALAFYPGNYVVMYPLAVEIEPSKQIVLIGPWKRLVVPIEEVNTIRDSTAWQVLQQGIVVKLSKRHGLLKSFIIHWAFGAEGKQLARAIEDEISRRDGG